MKPGTATTLLLAVVVLCVWALVAMDRIQHLERQEARTAHALDECRAAFGQCCR